MNSDEISAMIDNMKQETNKLIAIGRTQGHLLSSCHGFLIALAREGKVDNVTLALITSSYEAHGYGDCEFIRDIKEAKNNFDKEPKTTSAMDKLFKNDLDTLNNLSIRKNGF